MLFGKKPACDWLIVGLGNPGREYERSRHNMGFRALDLLAGTLGVSVKKAKFRALTAQASYRGQKLLLMKPETFMNASGMAVEQAVQYYKLPPERVLVLFDDISLAPGRIRVRPSGSAGGHNGIKSIISVLHSDEFPRVKIGVGEKPSPEYDLADWVLGQIPKPQQALIDTALQHAAEAALCIVESGCQRAAAEFNGL